MSPEGTEAFDALLRAVDRRRPDLVIAALPRRRGLEQLEALRRHTGEPVLALVWEEGGLDVADALEAGADDAIAKPYSPRLLMARVRALLRRRGASPSLVQPSVLQFEHLRIDLTTREVLLDGKNVDLPRREFDLLARLARNPRQVFTRAELLRDVWGVDDGLLGASTVTEHVRRLRSHLESDPRNPRWIVTVRSIGYRFEPGAPRGSTHPDGASHTMVSAERD
jgi:DNA-binding response OmpR family regulator